MKFKKLIFKAYTYSVDRYKMDIRSNQLTVTINISPRLYAKCESKMSIYLSYKRIYLFNRYFYFLIVLYMMFSKRKN